MNKKHQLVSELTDRIVNSGIILPEDTVARAPADFWKNYPDGHCDDSVCPSLEGQLSCLLESQLESILKDDHIQEGMEFHSLWKAWGTAGYLQCDPIIMDLPNDRVPMLRIRHDAYLHWMRGYGFQCSFDAYCNGSNGSSATNMYMAKRACTLSEYSERYEQDEGSAAWEQEYAVFRKAMMLRYPFEACAQKKSFYRVLQGQADIFDEFFNRTDKKCLRMGLDKSLGIRALRRKCQEAEPSGDTVLWIPLHQTTVRKGEKREEVFATLFLGETFVSLHWKHGGDKKLTINFPAWEKDTYMAELQGLDLAAEHPVYPIQGDYLYQCWSCLSLTLLTLAGVSYSGMWFHSPYVTMPSTHLFNQKDLVGSTEELGRVLYEHCRTYPSLDALATEAGFFDLP